MIVEDRIVKLFKSQLELVTTKKRYPAFVGGYGSGKTEALLNRALKLKFQNPKQDLAYYLPTFSLISIIAIPRFEEKLEDYGIPFKIYVSNFKPRVEIEDAGQILFRSMDKPGSIIGYQVAHSFVDEIDTMREKDALAAWQKIVARNRQLCEDGSQNTIAVATTPEGFKFTYNMWKNKPPSDEYHLIQASTYQNKYLKPEYIEDLLALYPANLVDAYLNGEFVNMTNGAVYPNFDRILNGCNTVIAPNEPLHIGQDFNVGKMASIIFVLRDNEAHAVGEICNVFDTPSTIVLLKQRYPGHPIIIYPDASGNARKTNQASQSDISLFNAANFNVFVNSVNPFVKDRVLSINTMICNANNERKFKVNIAKCPILVECLEKQSYDDNGEPDKTNDLDHPVDAAGYFIAYRYPIQNGQRARIPIHGR